MDNVDEHRWRAGGRVRSSQSRSSSVNELGDEEGEQDAERTGVQGRMSVLTGSVVMADSTSR